MSITVMVAVVLLSLSWLPSVLLLFLGVLTVGPPGALTMAWLLQMRTQEPVGQTAGPQQGGGYGSYGQYTRQGPPQQVPPHSFQQDSYASPQQADPRLNPPPLSGQQRPPAPADWAQDSQCREMPLDQSQGSGAYGQVPSGRRHVEPVSNPPHTMSNDPSEFGMGRRGRGGGQNASRGQTPPTNPAAAGTGAASVMALGQIKLPQRAEVPPYYEIAWNSGAYVYVICVTSKSLTQRQTSTLCQALASHLTQRQKSCFSF